MNPAVAVGMWESQAAFWPDFSKRLRVGAHRSIMVG